MGCPDLRGRFTRRFPPLPHLPSNPLPHQAPPEDLEAFPGHNPFAPSRLVPAVAPGLQAAGMRLPHRRLSLPHTPPLPPITLHLQPPLCPLHSPCVLVSAPSVAPPPLVGRWGHPLRCLGVRPVPVSELLPLAITPEPLTQHPSLCRVGPLAARRRRPPRDPPPRCAPCPPPPLPHRGVGTPETSVVDRGVEGEARKGPAGHPDMTAVPPPPVSDFHPLLGAGGVTSIRGS